MVSLFHKRVRRSRGKRRPDSKSHGLTEAGIRLLAQKDFEAISMARIAREAGCSVGALYSRFPEKNSYLYHLVAAGYRSLTDRAEAELDVRRWRQRALPFLVGHVVDHIVTSMTTARAAGVIRATAKLATIKPITIELFEDYRAAVTRLAVALLAPRLRGNSTGALKIGMQIVLATVTDAVLQPRPGPMAAGTRRMKDALTKILLGYLGVSEDDSWAGDEADGEDVTQDPGSPNESTEGQSTETITLFDPDLRVVRTIVPAAKARHTRRAKPPSPGMVVPSTGPRAAIASPSVKLVKRPSVPKPPPEPTKPKRRHRFI